MAGYSLVLLDADGTLFDYDKAEALALKRAFEHYGLSCSDDILSEYRKINMHLWMEFDQGRVDKDTLQTGRFERLFAKIHVPAEPVAFNEFYLDCLAEESWLIDGALDLCRELSSCCTMTIATNGISRVQKKRLENSEIARYISRIIVSEDAGCQKPQGGFFDYAFRVCGCPDKNSAIILGDSLRTDIKGGSDYGIKTCWYNPRGEKLESDSPKPDYVIDRLPDFMAVVKR